INSQTGIDSMWHLIIKFVKRRKLSALHDSSAQYAQNLIDGWSEQSQASNLSPHIKEAFSSK
ncbi:hypothetical protein SK128_008153, partial [Halocaridina rubra]